MTLPDLFFLLVFLLTIFDLVLIATRTAFTHVGHARLLGMREQLPEQTSRTLLLLPKLTRVRAAITFPLITARFLLAGLLVYYASQMHTQSPFLLVTGILLGGAFVLFWLEWWVERYISQTPDIWALRLTPFVNVLVAVLSWLLWLPLGFFIESEEKAELQVAVTEDELKTLVDAGQEEGLFERGERRMIISIFQLGDTLAREIMVPRIDMVAIEADTDLMEAVDILHKTGFSRVPVYEESVDNTLGLLYAKDLLRLWREGNGPESLRDLVRPAYFIPEAKKVDELLAEMQAQRVHMAIVVDEYGGVAGLVTLEDIIEEVVGEIRDEYDHAEESPYQVLKNGDYVFQGRVDLDDFNDIMGSELPADEADTIGGLIYSRMGRVPSVGETVQENSLLLTVEQVSGRRIRKVRARWETSQTLNEQDQERHGINP